MDSASVPVIRTLSSVQERRVWFSLSFPCDPRYVETAHDLVARIAEQIGYGAPAATGIAVTVHAAVQGLIDRAGAWGGERVVGLQVATGDGRFEVGLRLDGAAAVSRSAEQASFSQVAVGAMDRVEVDSEADALVCRLTKALPPAG